ncbi:MAG: nucleotidyl transferase AbiEii/AbiGii toxin family protein, partial [Bacteroidales bacterium]|nr:nucleotidyl transferase AbiEii/AbiGii toxin family protein [Bacteroidales bacterium]
MKLHENPELFSDAIIAASRPISEGGLGIKDIFIEKDYWISRSLQMLSKVDTEGKAVFKGGTSLSKAYGIGSRFSEDIDIAILDTKSMNGNQLKNLIKKTAKGMATGLDEIVIPGTTSKGSHYHKAFFQYPRLATTEQAGAIKAGQILIEISAFGNPYPYEKMKLKSFLTEFFAKIGQNKLIDEYEMHEFEIFVLDKSRTFTEKLVSLIRASLAENSIQNLTEKIRHFYDIHYLMQDEDVKKYARSEHFKIDFNTLIIEDQKRFEKPEGWQHKKLTDSPLINNLQVTWHQLQG